MAVSVRQALIVLVIALYQVSGQSTGPNLPLSAVPSEEKNDPTGKAALFDLWGYEGTSGYVNSYNYQFTPDRLNLAAHIDPGNGVPSNANGAEVGSFAVVGDTGAAAVHALQFANDLLFLVWRASNLNGTSFNPLLAVDGGDYSEFAATYNMTTHEFKPYHMAEHPFCAAHLLLPDGENGLIVGGEPLQLNPPHLINGIQHIRVFNSITQEYRVVATMERGRWYPSVMTLNDGNILIVGGSQQEAGGFGSTDAPSSSSQPTVECKSNAGGTGDPLFSNPTYQIFYPANNTFSPSLVLTIMLQSWPINLYSYLIQLPSGSTLVVAGAHTQALYFTPEGVYQDEELPNLPGPPRPINFPQYSGLTLLPLEPPRYEARILGAGGSADYCANQKSNASSESFLQDVTPGANHEIVIEDMAFPRIMAELTTLPDGTILMCNGAQVGQSNGGGPNASAAGVGTTVCELYDPKKPVGERWSVLGDSGIWRFYHSWTLLTKNATVWIGGSDVTNERRIQEWTPPYLLNGKPRPAISGVPSSLTYGQDFQFDYSGVPSIDRIVLSRLVGATHANHFDERQVVLVNSSSAITTASIQSSSIMYSQAPPNSSVAPPGLYMLFASYGGVPSVAEFVLLEPADGPLPYASLKAGPSVYDNLPYFEA